MNTNAPTTGQAPEEGEFSLEDIDKIIASEDPTFISEMEDLKTVVNDGSAIIESLDPDEIPVDNLIEEKPVTRLDHLRAFVFRHQDKINYWWMKEKAHLRQRQLQFKTWLNENFLVVREFVRHELPDRLRYVKGRITKGAIIVANQFEMHWSKFKALTRLQKFGLFFTCIASVLSLLILSKSITGGWLPRWHVPLMGSLAEQAEFTGTISKQSDLQDLFQAFPEVEFHVLLKKVIVNLRADENSSSTPMGLYEVYLGVDTQNTAIEVKDREKEMQDVIQRALEIFTYTEVSTRLGKDRMKSAIKEELNKVLNQGQVFRVYFNNFVTKP